jgi:hypothetical protein
MPTSPMKQTHFQWFSDDGAPASNSPLRREDSNLAAVTAGSHMALRVQCQHTGRHSLSARRQLQWRKVGSSVWAALAAAGAPPYGAPLCHPSTWFADGDAITTQRLSTPTTANTSDFLGGEAKQSETATSSLTYGPQDFTEDLWVVWVHPMAPGGLDLEFRVTREGQPLERYASYPRLTVAGYAPSEMDVKANQLSAEVRPLAQVHFWRDNTWWDLSDRLLFPLTITRRLKAVTTAEIVLDNADGMLARDSRVSSWNYDVTSHFDPLLDEGRKIRVRQGVELHPNLAYGKAYSCTESGPTRPTSLLGTELTDGGFGQPRNELDDAWVGWQGTPATVKFSLSPARHVGAVAVSLLTRAAAGVLLPSSGSVTLMGSAGTLTAPLPLDHLRDDPAGRRQYVYGLDLDQRDVAQVTFRFFPKSPQAWICMDEVAMYDASTTLDWLKTTFTGLLGDEITQYATDRGVVHLGQVRDVSKRLADLFVEVFDNYQDMTIEGIVEDLLVNPRYEAEASAAECALDTTGFTMPKWTEQNASVLDACAQLAKMIGWVFEADDEGVYRLHDLEWEAQSGEETYLAGRDLMGWAPAVSGINLRNRIVVKSRDARNAEIRVVVEDGESIARYGPRAFTIFEPTLRTAPLARRLASAVRRDYSWVQPMGSGVMAGDVLMRPGRVVSVVHSGCTHSGPEQLYRVEGVVHQQTGHRHGQHAMTLDLRGYRHRAPSAPDSLVAQPLDQGVSLNWAAQPEEPNVVGYRVFQAGSMSGTYAQVASTAAPPAVVTSLTNQQTYWFKVAGYTSGDVLGEFAGPVPCAPQSGGLPVDAAGAWQPQSLSIDIVQIWAVRRPRLIWWPRLAAPLGTCYNIYRSQVSAGPFALVGTRTQPGSWQVVWMDYGAGGVSGDLYYEVTYYDPASDFESWPSSMGHVVMP